ncbi:lytic transglycosylase domain-containing protein [Cupriavidus pauculus]|uniref:lytic transglycosylase domain-containing protein n=1 Tax=Cupriavidus pauculus TaxID=82633 RepID=UPI0038572FE5
MRLLAETGTRRFGGRRPMLAMVAACAIALAGATSALANCWEAVSAKYGIPVALLKAIAEQESGFNNGAVNKNANGSRDVCMMQINSSHFPELERRFGITEKKLTSDACTCLDVGGWILYGNAQRLGGWDAVGAYNAASPDKRSRYAWRIYPRLERYRAAEQR